MFSVKNVCVSLSKLFTNLFKSPFLLSFIMCYYKVNVLTDILTDWLYSSVIALTLQVSQPKKSQADCVQHQAKVCLAVERLQPLLQLVHQELYLTDSPAVISKSLSIVQYLAIINLFNI